MVGAKGQEWRNEYIPEQLPERVASRDSRVRPLLRMGFPAEAAFAANRGGTAIKVHRPLLRLEQRA